MKVKHSEEEIYGALDVACDKVRSGVPLPWVQRWSFQSAAMLPQCLLPCHAACQRTAARDAAKWQLMPCWQRACSP